MANKILIPPNSIYMGKPISEWKQESKSNTIPVQPKVQSKIIPPNSFGKVIPLEDSNNKKEFTVMEALVEAKKQGKSLASLNDADKYVLKNGGHFWTGDLIAYCAPNNKLGNELIYKDGNGVSYKLKIPSNFQNLNGETALILPYGDNPQNPNYEFIQEKNNLWTVKIINPSLILPTNIHRTNDWYETDSNMFPNGVKSDSSNLTARYFRQVDDGSYLGLLQRGDYDDRQYVNAYRRPSDRHGVLVYE